MTNTKHILLFISSLLITYLLPQHFYNYTKINPNIKIPLTTYLLEKNVNINELIPAQITNINKITEKDLEIQRILILDCLKYEVLEDKEDIREFNNEFIKNINFVKEIVYQKKFKELKDNFVLVENMEIINNID